MQPTSEIIPFYLFVTKVNQLFHILDYIVQELKNFVGKKSKLALNKFNFYRIYPSLASDKPPIVQEKYILLS